MKEIEYKTDGVTCITPCPNGVYTVEGEKIKVGSTGCFRCVFHRGVDDDERDIVHCAFDESGKQNKAEPVTQNRECRKPSFHEGDKVWYNFTPEDRYEATIKEVIINYTEVVYLIHIEDGEMAGYMRVMESDLSPRVAELVSEHEIDAAIKKNEMIHQKMESSRKNLSSVLCKNAPLCKKEFEESEESDAVNSPKYYNRYSVEVVEMARRIWGDEAMKTAAEITAFIYRMRAGVKPDNPWEQDIGKEEWWLNYRAKI